MPYKDIEVKREYDRQRYWRNLDRVREYCRNRRHISRTYARWWYFVRKEPPLYIDRLFIEEERNPKLEPPPCFVLSFD